LSIAICRTLSPPVLFAASVPIAPISAATMSTWSWSQTSAAVLMIAVTFAIASSTLSRGRSRQPRFAVLEHRHEPIERRARLRRQMPGTP
jgi:hypothetical protein